jgi:sugar phosphate isomerase/epimerase
VRQVVAEAVRTSLVSERPMVKMSMNELSTYSWTFDEDVMHYLQADYEAVGVWRPKLTDYGEQRGIELLRDHGLAVSNLLWAGGFTGSDGRRYQESIDDAIEAIHLAEELATDCLVLYTGSRAGHTLNHARRMCRNALRELLPVAESCGVTLALEPVASECGGEWTFLHSLESAHRFLDEIPSPYLKLAFDTYYLGQGAMDLAEVEAIGNRVAVVHLGDARSSAQGEENRCLLGEGRVPNAEIVQALIEGGFDGYCDVKLFGEDLELCCYHRILEHSRAALSQLIGV